MRGARPVALVAVSFAGLLALSSCSFSPGMGVRLNADGTVDQVLCGGGGFEVDYVVADSDVGALTEWPDDEATGVAQQGVVIRYGEIPAGMTSPSRALPPPPGWTTVLLSDGSFERDELVEGEWVWNTNLMPWVPGRPCRGVELDAAGEPRE